MFVKHSSGVVLYLTFPSQSLSETCTFIHLYVMVHLPGFALFPSLGPGRLYFQLHFLWSYNATRPVTLRFTITCHFCYYFFTSLLQKLIGCLTKLELGFSFPPFYQVFYLHNSPFLFIYTTAAGKLAIVVDHVIYSCIFTLTL